MCRLVGSLFVLGTLLAGTGAHAASSRPNVVLIVTDDQGYPDLGSSGNPVLKTPALDQLWRESVRLANYHVDPTCSPTRAALMTGRYSTRTGVWHTVMGRHMPRADELMMPEVFAVSGYATAIFGKWHLGDSYPFRPQDRGFGTTVVLGGGGVGQIPDYWDNDYFDDTYFRNGRPEKFTGYCTDVFFREALGFIESHRAEPFFVYLCPNAPHGPYRVAEEWAEPYRKLVGKDRELAAFYGMIANIDWNVGRLRERLVELGLAENTLVIFMTDNGTARGATFTDFRGNEGKLVSGYSAGLRGRKGSPYEGGHRTACFAHWPGGQLTGGRDIAGLSAHFDWLPTLVDLCGLKLPRSVAFDGMSLRDVLSGKTTIPADRLLFAHHQELVEPERYRFAAVMQEPWRLILRNDVADAPRPSVELFDMLADGGQQTSIAAQHPDVAGRLRAAYDRWWNELASDFGRPAEIVIGDEHQNPSELTRFEWYDSQQWWQTAVKSGFEGNGYWSLRVARPGRYEITLRRWPREVDVPIVGAVEGGKALAIDRARLRIGSYEDSRPVTSEMRCVTFDATLPAGSTRMQTWFSGTDGHERGAYYASVRRVGD